jgi:hypothetical protein
MHATDLNHYPDARDAITPETGPARRMTDFPAAVVARASDIERADDAPGPPCFKSRRRARHAVDTAITDDDVVVRNGAVSATGSRNSNGPGSLRGLTQRRPSN